MSPVCLSFRLRKRENPNGIDLCPLNASLSGGMDSLRQFASKASNAVTSHLRAAVSGQKTRFQKDGFDLDLTYITPRIIAMAIPSDSLESMWRNNIDDVSRFLQTYHKDHFLVFNLTEGFYDYSKFGGMVRSFGWLDHHSPPMWLLHQIVVTIDEWLRQDEQNVAIIHCKAGKGRTGTVIASYLLHCGIAITPDEALQLFAKRRFYSYGLERTAGVDMPSQVRAVHYYAKIVNQTIPLQMLAQPRRLKLRKVVLHPIPRLGITKQGCQPILELLQDAQRAVVAPLHSTASDQPRTYDSDADTLIMFDFFGVKTDVEGDVMLRVFNSTGLGIKQMMFRLWFHTSFLEPEQYWLDLVAANLDASDSGSIMQDTAFSSEFKVRLLFEEPLTPSPISAANLSSSPPER